MLVLIKVNVLNCKTVKNHKYVQVLVADNLSFHNVRLLGHNGTSKPVKVPILSLALLAAVAGKLTARTTFKVLSFFGGCLQLEQTLYTLALLTTTSLSLSSLSMVSRISQRIACSLNDNRSGSAGLGIGFSEDTRSVLLPQARLVFSSSFTHTEFSESCWSSSGEAKSGFPANFFSRNRACLFLERANAEGDHAKKSQSEMLL